MKALALVVSAASLLFSAGCVRPEAATEPIVIGPLGPPGPCTLPSSGAGIIAHVSVNGSEGPTWGALFVRTIDAPGNYTHYQVDAGSCAFIPVKEPETVAIEVELGCSAFQQGAIMDYSRFGHANPVHQGTGWMLVNVTLDRGCDVPSDLWR